MFANQSTTWTCNNNIVLYNSNPFVLPWADKERGKSRMSKSVVINRRRVVVVVVVVGGRLRCRQILKRTRILDKYSDETFMMADALPKKNNTTTILCKMTVIINNNNIISSRHTHRKLKKFSISIWNENNCWGTWLDCQSLLVLCYMQT